VRRGVRTFKQLDGDRDGQQRWVVDELRPLHHGTLSNVARHELACFCSNAQLEQSSADDAHNHSVNPSALSSGPRTPTLRTRPRDHVTDTQLVDRAADSRAVVSQQEVTSEFGQRKT
jgi:hypothetical protein